MKKTGKIELYQPDNSNSYTIESLAYTIPSIRLIYEHTFRHTKDGQIEIKRTNAYSRDPSLIKAPQCPEYFTLEAFYRTFGNESKEIFRVLQRKGFVSLSGRKVLVNQKTKLASPESFHLGYGEEKDKEILMKLNSVLWRKISMDRDDLGNLDPMAESLFSYQGSTVIGEKGGIANYKFRIGHTILSVEFFSEPAIELLELVSLRILLIFQEQLQNFFAASAVQNYNMDVWLKTANKREMFFQIVSTFLYHSWNPFDLEECVILIKSGKGLYSFADGRITYAFDFDGNESSAVEDCQNLERTVSDSSREFIQNDIDIGINREKMETIHMSIYLKSRSCYNVDPRYNRLSHHYIKMFIESVGKLIDVIIPIIQRESARQALKWKTFYDKTRMVGHKVGENINRIIYESVRVLKSVYYIEDVVFYSEDPTILDMINVFRQLEENKFNNFSYRYRPLNEHELIEGNYIACSLNDNIKERIILYLKPPSDKRSDTGKYLSGTMLYRLLAEASSILGTGSPDDLAGILSHTSISLNLTLTQRRTKDKLVRRFPGIKQDAVTSVLHKLTMSFQEFFALLDTINININSSISTMRGSRDSLTGLYNRQTFNRKIETYFNEYVKSGPGFGIMFIDMDAFKIYNDTVNHSFGDKLIIRLAEHLLRGQRDISYESIPSRFGGDEFCFAIDQIEPEKFEEAAFTIFAAITLQPVEVTFYIGDFQENGGFEINLLSFLHRFIRPDIGGERGEITGYRERENESPREHIVNIFIHYLQEGSSESSDTVAILEQALMEERISDTLKEKIIKTLREKICYKIINNHILKEIDKEFEKVIHLFLKLQLDNKTTGDIRNELMDSMGSDRLERTLYQRVSIGLSHSSEDRLRSVSSIFKQADARSYLAKQSGKNCIFGLNNKQIKKSYKNEISILIIDDEQDYINMLQRQLIEKYHWPNVFNFLSEEEGGFSYSNLKDIDIIILDLKLYSDDDFNFILAYLQGLSENREVQIIVNSGYVSQKEDQLNRLKDTQGIRLLAVLEKNETVYKEIDRIISERFNIAMNLPR